MPLNFTAVDFETANFHRGSACAAGITVVRDGEITAVDSWFINPPVAGAFFTNTHVHGISHEHVIGAPSWGDAVARIQEAAEGYPLVAYSPFEKSVSTAVAKALPETAIELDFLDMLAVARLNVPSLTDHRLTTLVEHFQLPPFAHHHPGEDSRACALVAIALAREAQSESIGDLWQLVLDHRAAARAAKSQRWSDLSVRKGDLPAANPDADPTHPLFGHVVCFSGALPGMSRDAARNVAAEHGATIDLSVTKKTTILVVGDFDPTTLRPGATFSSKVQKALTLAESGQPIEVMVATDFLALVDG